jgi:hypothetical protein
MDLYIVKYCGESRNAKNYCSTELADSERDAIEKVLQKYFSEDYFAEEDGTIYDSSGNCIAEPDDNTIEFGDGYFYAEKLTYDVVFDDDNSSDRKGFAESLSYCKDYIQLHNGTNESYFEDYKGGTVSVICKQTGDNEYAETVK